MFKPVFIAATAAFALLAGGAQAANLLTNGGFEQTGGATLSGSYGYTYGPGFNPTLPGWSVTSGTVDVVLGSSLWGPAAEGALALDLNGYNAGAISQTFATLAGQKYFVSYAYSRNPAGAPDPATALLSVGSFSQLVTAASSGAFGSAFNVQWQNGGFSFFATGPTSTLTVASQVPSAGGVFFDNFSVQSVPEPATWAMMIGGLGLVGGALRRRRSLVAA